VARTDPITIDLENRVVTTPFQDRFVFEIDPFRKACLMDGLDEIGLTLARHEAIGEYEQRRARDMPWLAPSANEATEKAA
jgi:3-isopropylmalate/(R)-2-methylmalate dehydratase small subunit